VLFLIISSSNINLIDDNHWKEIMLTLFLDPLVSEFARMASSETQHEREVRLINKIFGQLQVICS
jgi:hypothetical protein